MDELDDLYSRTRLLWEVDPEAFEKENPLLARAFQDQPIDQTLTVQSLNAQLEGLAAKLRRKELDADGQLAMAHGRERLLKKEWEAERRGAHALAGELVEARKQLAWARRRPKITPEEAAMLSEMGLSKGLAPD